MATAEQSDDTFRDYSSPATWGDVERVRLSVETQIATRTADLETHLVTRTADLETQLATTKADLEKQIATTKADLETQAARAEARLTRWIVGAVAGGVGAMGLLLGILEAVR